MNQNNTSFIVKFRRKIVIRRVRKDRLRGVLYYSGHSACRYMSPVFIVLTKSLMRTYNYRWIHGKENEQGLPISPAGL